mgnify:CR=1 FL=1
MPRTTLTRRMLLGSTMAAATTRVAHAQPAPERITPALIAAAVKEGKVSHYTSDDLVQATAMAKLFREEADTRQLFKMKELYQLLESVTDRCQDVANIIEGIVLENA